MKCDLAHTQRNHYHVDLDRSRNGTWRVHRVSHDHLGGDRWGGTRGVKYARYFGSDFAAAHEAAVFQTDTSSRYMPSSLRLSPAAEEERDRYERLHGFTLTRTAGSEVGVLPDPQETEETTKETDR